MHDRRKIHRWAKSFIFKKVKERACFDISFLKFSDEANTQKLSCAQSVDFGRYCCYTVSFCIGITAFQNLPNETLSLSVLSCNGHESLIHAIYGSYLTLTCS